MSLWKSFQKNCKSTERTKQELRRKNRTCRQAKRPQFESLENRQLLAGDVYVSNSGNLVILGTDNRDIAEVRDVRVNGSNMIRVTLNGRTSEFRQSQVSGRIEFFGYGGDDRFNYVGERNCMASGGSGNDFLSGDQGNDLLFGGAGNDTLEGWGGADELQGGADNDRLFGGVGNDRLFGESGNDRLDGGEGADFLSCGTGVDVVFANLAQDRLADMTTTRMNRSVRFGVGVGGRSDINFSVPAGQTIVNTRIVQENARNAFAISPEGINGRTSFGTTVLKGSNVFATGSYSVDVDVNHVRSGITVNTVRT